MLKQTIEEETIATSSLLRFNVLSRKSTVLNSKSAKKEEATHYLMAEMDMIESHLDQLLAPPASDHGQNEETSNQEVQTNATAVYNRTFLKMKLKIQKQQHRRAGQYCRRE